MKKFLIIILIFSIFIGVFSNIQTADAQTNFVGPPAGGSEVTAEVKSTQNELAELYKTLSKYSYWTRLLGPLGLGIDGAKAAVDSGSAGDVVSQVIGAILSFFMWVSSWLLFVAAALFNLAIDKALNFGGDQGGIREIVNFGWSLFRDISNIIFIFIILWIGISTILNIKGGSAKNLLVKVVIVALLINFSLFFTEVIIDISNTIAVGFYNEIVTDAEELAAASPGAFDFTESEDGTIDYKVGLSELIVAKLQLTTLYEQVTLENGEAALVPKANIQEESNLVYFMGIIFILVATFVLLAGAVLFTLRTIVLLFLMILSPLAYIGSLLPSTSGYAKEWLNKLLGQAQFAPLFIILIFVSIRGLDALDLTNTSGGFGAAFTTANPSNLDVIFNFALVIGIMIGALVISKKLSVFGADVVVKGTKNAAGRVAGVTAGFTGRQTFGRLGERIARSDDSKVGQFLKEGSASNSRIVRGISDAGLRFADKTSQQSFDVRGLKSVPGKASKGGFKKDYEEKVKREVAFTKSLGKKPLDEERDREEIEKIKEQKNKVGDLKSRVRELKNSGDKVRLEAERSRLAKEEEELIKLENPRQTKRAEARKRPTIISQVGETVAPRIFKAGPSRFGAESAKKIEKGLKANWKDDNLREQVKKWAKENKLLDDDGGDNNKEGDEKKDES